MNEWELTTEEIEQARDYGEYEYEDDTLEVGQFIEEEVLAGNRAIATAAQRKLFEHLMGDCTEHEPPAYVMAIPQPRRECVECLLEIREALGVK